ncbi:HD phosphohydrolase [Fadolivirus algeromassiliense]|jgi:HD superfamily phosphohydrolase|uniref:HD phosphohydrolase n=1 Tax=Fadolivirus FV1/VV64 TaxID=3070911 RepID=A0A7D3R1K3_9VIRU|nr:HD phosphohydrolase [Fadolivirus algeromassiliense]QKF93858.1 HD phosphohydrolase [Fadolivirus FV1/VV64]
MDILKYFKEIYDPIHGSYIKVTYLAMLIIDSPLFQRLRYLHQLGTCHFVFPSGTHTRFEHSIGTYYLTGRVLDSIKLNSDPVVVSSCLKDIPELKKYYINREITLDPYICELIKIAGLCHDIGHGPFSHVFDDIFLKNIGNGKSPFECHEVRSEHILKYIIKNNEILKNIITSDQIEFILTLINPSKKNNGFIYQIVSNGFNSIDVDKFDYLCRDTHYLGLKYSIDANRLIEDMKVIDNKICFPDKIQYEIISLFKTRYRLHKQIYCHKAVISIQYMINDIMFLLNDLIGIYDSIKDPVKFTDLTEDYIITYLKILYKNINNYDDVNKDKIKKAYNLWERVTNRDLYKLIYASVSRNPVDFNQILNGIDMDKIILYKSKIGFVSGSKDNPLNNVFYYNKNSSNNCAKEAVENVSYLVPKIYQEHIYMIFIKNRNDTETENKLKQNLVMINEHK